MQTSQSVFAAIVRKVALGDVWIEPASAKFLLTISPREESSVIGNRLQLNKEGSLEFCGFKDHQITSL
jgi:hypothetical protein